jgi:hypothetical protein
MAANTSTSVQAATDNTEAVPPETPHVTFINSTLLTLRHGASLEAAEAYHALQTRLRHAQEDSEDYTHIRQCMDGFVEVFLRHLQAALPGANTTPTADDFTLYGSRIAMRNADGVRTGRALRCVVWDTFCISRALSRPLPVRILPTLWWILDVNRADLQLTEILSVLSQVVLQSQDKVPLSQYRRFPTHFLALVQSGRLVLVKSTRAESRANAASFDPLNSRSSAHFPGSL